jgi:conjugal transfer pilus assembly protein TraI
MISKLKRWLSGPEGPAVPFGLQTTPGGDQEIPRYPPFISGLPMCSPDRLIETQQDMIQQIKDTLGLGADEYEAYIEPLIENCAAFVHLLPASEAHHHRGAGGLFRHSLEVGAYAAKFAEGKIFAFGKSPQERKEEEPRWVVAAFTAALMHDIGKAATDMAVTDSTGNLHWAPYLDTLWGWGSKNKVDRYFVRWHDNRHKNHEQTGLLLASQVLPASLKGWLGERNPEIIRSMLEASACRGEHVLTSLVERADSASVERDLKVNRTLGTEMSVGVPVERHLLDASRRLLGNGTWTVNKKGSRVWVTEAGVFIVWKAAAEDIVHLLSEDRVPGIPRDKDTLADLLLDRDLATPNGEDDPEHPKRYWSLSPAVLEGRNGPLWLQCLKITDPQLLFSSEPPPFARALLKGAGGEDVLLAGAGPDPAPEATTQERVEPASSQGEARSPSLKKEGAPKVEKRPAPAAKPGIRMPGREEQRPLPLEEEQSSSSESPKQEASPQTHATEAEPDLSEARSAEIWLKSCGNEAAGLLLNILKDIQLGIVEKNAIFGTEGGVAYLRYPDAVRPYGKPSDIAQMFSQAGWLVPDPENPMRKARDMAGGKAIIFSTELGEKLLPLLRDGVTPPKLEAPKSPARKTKPAPRPTEAESAPAPKPQPKSNAGAAKKPEPLPSQEEGRPPEQKRLISSEASEIAETFVKAVRSGKIPPIQTRTDDDVSYIVVGMSQLAKYASERNPPAALREAIKRRDDAEIRMNGIVVRDK